MLWVYDIVYSYNARISFSRQNLTSEDVRFWRLKPIPALQGLGAVHEFNSSIFSASLSSEIAGSSPALAFKFQRNKRIFSAHS